MSSTLASYKLVNVNETLIPNYYADSPNVVDVETRDDGR